MDSTTFIRYHFDIVRLSKALDHIFFDSEEEYRAFCVGYLEGVKENQGEMKALWDKLVANEKLSCEERLKLLNFEIEIDKIFEVLPSTQDDEIDGFLKLYIKSFLLN